MSAVTIHKAPLDATALRIGVVRSRFNGVVTERLLRGALRALRECGVGRVSLPAVAVFSALQAVKRTLALIRAHEDFEEILRQNLLCSMQDVAPLLGK
jgi:6,7-dimethyl-8-ribityllumazine synthase